MALLEVMALLEGRNLAAGIREASPIGKLWKTAFNSCRILSIPFNSLAFCPGEEGFQRPLAGQLWLHATLRGLDLWAGAREVSGGMLRGAHLGLYHRPEPQGSFLERAM